MARATKKQRTVLKDRTQLKLPDTFTNSHDITSLNYLADMLSYRRPAGSVTEEVFIEKYIKTIPGVERDGYGNYILHVRGDDNTLVDVGFSAHTDTVHWNEGMQPIYMIDDPQEKYLCNDGNDVLGADDATGIWLMLNMIRAQIPGTYFFFREEEVGGNGSNYVQMNEQEHWKHLNKLISFDRMDKNSIITHQGGGRCCSENFSKDLAGELNQSTGFKFKSDGTGTFTDSANFMDVIPECTNLSVGYEHQHTLNEIQVVDWLIQLRDRLLLVDWAALGVYRDPKQDDYRSSWEDYAQLSLDKPFTRQDEASAATIRYLCYNHPDLVEELLLSRYITNTEILELAEMYGAYDLEQEIFEH